MNNFEFDWRRKILSNTAVIVDRETALSLRNIVEIEEEAYTNTLIQSLKDKTVEEKIKQIFQCSACHIPHTKLDQAKQRYEETHSIEETRDELQRSFEQDIKEYKNLTDEQVHYIIEQNWGLAGTYLNGDIIATKIPSMFHEYFSTEDEVQKKFYYCHCPRVRKVLLHQRKLDSIYCNCGGGFYKDVWEYITGKEVSITVEKNLFDGDAVCQFRISF